MREQRHPTPHRGSPGAGCHTGGAHISPSPAPPTPTPTPVETPSPAPTQPATSAPQGDFVLAAEQESNVPGVPAGVTEDGAPYRGNPDAPVTMIEYSDYQCPFCRRYFEETSPTLTRDYIATGKVRHVFKNFPLTGIHPQAVGAAQAAMCAGVQGKFWPMHDLLFERQDDWAGNENAAEVFRSLAEELNLDMDAYNACWDAQPFGEQIQREMAEGQALGVRGTPAFFINDWFINGAQPYSSFQAVIEKSLAGERPTPTPTPSYADLHPFEPDPDRPGRTYMGDAYIGSADAPVVILEISDPLCPYCRRHHTEVWPEFKAKYVDTGLVRVVYKHLLGRETSLPAAEAMECAGNQGKFWEYVDLLFAEQDAWRGLSGDELTAALKGYAQELGLDEDAFATCLDTNEMREKVQQDHRTVIQARVRGTPTFIVIVRGETLGRVPGFLTMEQWEQVMEQVQAAVDATATPAP